MQFTRRTIVCQRENPTMDISITEDWQSHLMDFEVISQATNFFSDSNKIGEGGFGSVYKGRLLNGVEIAVKRLISMTPNGIENFDNEVRLIGLVQHINIIRLIGFFSDENEKILVYEHLENLGLDSYIFDTTRSSSLNWKKRFDIIIGIARGLLYLHQDSRFKIIHLDLKPSNILLGKDMIPKISDFGMAKTLARDETEAIATTAAGTFGYMPLEYLRDKIYSVKSDVFSFGVLLLEILSGKRNNRFPALNDGESLLSYIWSNWSEGKGLEIVDPAITYSTEFRPDQVLRCIQIGLLCVQQLAQDRPTMWPVVFMLGSETVDIDRPKSPGDDTCSSSMEHLDDATYTVCQMSMSAMKGR
ncbi:receptor-like serine/threonine-protein kinase SD1-8 [Arabidopsis lyrata subsp. lyrata]|uniref:receptor-like serine/threonine-protein kinase SD1-8 n=1 Tax=Arabidopsis lyrata subsp. lyrata TaxID=81972 RepID=UPI000A29D286|nr:receptor-like serine/threonine-protein kinase SD1-8 [Arabidopsis lyrata subsp. lyrata]|eukprot:XP_020891745.1 receptor-like serine/threonine-protein kinase SD1-8 [Arabidopsis lyrata subsp. lyrata]